MAKDARDLVTAVDQLASFPEVALRIDEAIADEKSSAEDIGKLIQPDPALTAALLRVANSAAYSLAVPIDNIAAAVRVVGMREIRDLTYAICATNTFKGMPNDLISVEDFWLHSLYCAVAAQSIADTARVCRGISVFTAGLLHDIGHLVMFNQHPELSRQALLRSVDLTDGRENWLAEREVFGFDHMDVGRELARLWKLPESLLAAISHHHQPENCSDLQDVAMVVHAANSVAVLIELESENLADAPTIDLDTVEHLRLDLASLHELTETTRETANDLVHLFVR